MAWLVYIGWVISYANEWEDYSNYFGEGGREFLDVGHHPLLGLLTVPWNCHSTSGCVISLAYLGSRGSEGKVFACNVGDPGSIPGWGRSSVEGNGKPLQYS